MKKYILSSVVMLLLSGAVMAQKADSIKAKPKVDTSTTEYKAKRTKITAELKEIEQFIQILGDLKQKDYETLADPKRTMREFYMWKAQQLNY